MKNPFLFFVMLLLIKGVLHEETGEQKTADETLSVMEGENVTLGSDIAKKYNNDRIVWTFGNTRIAQMNVEPGKISLYDGDHEVFHNKLQLNKETGDLTITYVTTEHTGVYKIANLNSEGSKIFIVNVTHLPVPTISINASSPERSSVSKCALLCSVMNVTHVSLSWYKGNSLLSSISVSDLNIRLSLPLEVEYHDTNTYRCVISNPVSNQTQHLNITHVCGLIPPAHGLQQLHIALIVIFAALFTVVAVFVGICYKKFRKPEPNAQPTEEELRVLNGSSPADQRNVGLNDGDEVDQPNDARVETSNLEAYSHSLLNDEDEVEQPNDGLNTTEYDDEINDEIKEIKDEFKTLYVQEGECVTLQANELIEDDDVIQWRFAESRLNTIKTEVIAERTNANDGKTLCSDKTLQLDNQTGFLTIKNITPKDAGHYKLWIPKKRISKTFNITVNTRVKGDITTDKRRGANSGTI